MGLGKLVVDVPSLVTMLLEENDTVRWKLSNTENFPDTSKILDIQLSGREILVTLVDNGLPDSTTGKGVFAEDMIESLVKFTKIEGFEDHKQRDFDRMALELENIFRLNQLARGLGLADFSKRFTYLAQRCLAVQRGQDPEELAQPEGTVESSNNQPG